MASNTGERKWGTEHRGTRGKIWHGGHDGRGVGHVDKDDNCVNDDINGNDGNDDNDSKEDNDGNDDNDGNAFKFQLFGSASSFDEFRTCAA